ncbi:MAG: hypothetical protein AAFP68_10365 [Pseudomonadota bacterium]
MTVLVPTRAITGSRFGAAMAEVPSELALLCAETIDPQENAKIKAAEQITREHRIPNRASPSLPGRRR